MSFSSDSVTASALHSRLTGKHLEMVNVANNNNNKTKTIKT